MADTFTRTKSELPRRRWSAREDAVLKKAVNRFTGPDGKFTHGSVGSVIEFVHPILDRSKTGILRRIRRLCQNAANHKAFKEYVPLHLLDTEAAWLAGLLDSDGSVGECYPRTDSRTGSSHGLHVRVHPVFNTNRPLAESVHALLPMSVIVVKEKSSKRRELYDVQLNGYRPILDYLTAVVPYMRHSDRVARAERVIREIEGRL